MVRIQKAKYYDPMIHSILDDDLYKFSMQNAVVKLFPRAKVRYKFFNRPSKNHPHGVVFTKRFVEALREQIKFLSYLVLTKEELEWCNDSLGHYIARPYFVFLSGYKFDPNEVNVSVTEDGKLVLGIHGYWYSTILWEVVLMALISELYYKETGVIISEEDFEGIFSKINEDIRLIKLHKLLVADFSTRRRRSYAIQDLVVREMANANAITGTSNVHLAMKHGIKPIGTHAHEWFMFIAAKYGYKIATKIALEKWSLVYKGLLGIALSDTFTTGVFFKSFDPYFAKLFDGVRHDSGDPFDFMRKVEDHYIGLNINPISKTIVFSDGLNMKKAIEINEYCRNIIMCSFGIGTYFSNHFGGIEHLNMVIKMTEAFVNGNWTPTIKLSDEPGKNTGIPDAIELAKRNLMI